MDVRLVPHKRLLLVAAGLFCLQAALAWPRPARAEPPAPLSKAPQRQDIARVQIHVEGAADAVLQQDAHGDGQWTTVCTGSCDAQVPLGSAYRIDGDGIRTSSAFHLAPGGHRVTLDVSPGRTGRFVLGVVLVPLGLGAVVGGSWWVIASLLTNGGSEPMEPQPASATPGYVAIGLGAAAIIGGIVLIVHDATTGVQQQDGAPAAPLPAIAPVAPAWREPAPIERALPVATAAPLWMVRF